MKTYGLSLGLLLIGCASGDKGEDDTGSDTFGRDVRCDGDGDGFEAGGEGCGNEDCQPDDPLSYPGAEEIPGDGVDNDCDGNADTADPSTYDTGDDDDETGGEDSDTDEDLDGYDSGDDCDDSRADIYPGADELCGDALDNDCDGETDEADAIDALTWYADGDGDGYGDPAVFTVACTVPAGHVDNADDCDDSAETIHPEATEVCDENDQDEDCDGDKDDADDSVDEASYTTWYRDADEDGHGDRSLYVRACEAPGGYVALDDDCDDDSEAVNPDMTEVCNDIDDDCDGYTDPVTSAGAATWSADADGDSYGDARATTIACDAPAGYVADDTDCDDTDDTINPGADEHCDDIDENCNGVADDGAIDPSTWYADRDGDTYGDQWSPWESCDALPGFVASSSDCDDLDDDIHPGADEHCDGVDEDCDDVADDNPVDAPTWYADTDSDDYGDSDNTRTACSAPSGYLSNNTDCDDTRADIYPGADDDCADGYDSDCDGELDEDSFVVAQEVDIGSGSNPIFLVDMAWDTDGSQDLLVAAYGHDYARPLSNTGSGTFTRTDADIDLADEPRGLSPGRIWGSSGEDFAAINLNLDGGARAWLCNVEVSSADLSGCYYYDLYDHGYGTEPRAVQLLDCNRNGDQDAIAVGDNGDGYLRLWNIGDVEDSGAPSGTSEVDFGDPYEELALATSAGPLQIRDDDLDGVGAEDLVVSNGGAGTFSVVLIGSSSCNVPDRPISYAIDASDDSVFVAGTATQDFVGGSAVDVAVVWRSDSGAGVSIYRNTGSGGLTLHHSFDLPATSHPDAISAPDLNDDGYHDLAIAYAGLGTVGLWVFDSDTETFLESAELNLSESGGSSRSYDPREIVWEAGGYDTDGDVDLAVANYGADSVSILHNQCVP